MFKIKLYITFLILFLSGFKLLAETNDKKDSVIIFRIQIAASSKRIDSVIIKKNTRLNEPIIVDFDEKSRLFKFMIRSFPTFDNAHNFLDSLKQNYGAFIVMYLNQNRQTEKAMDAYVLTQGIEIDSNQRIIRRIVKETVAPEKVKPAAIIIAKPKTAAAPVNKVQETYPNPKNIFESTINLMERIKENILIHVNNLDVAEETENNISYLEIMIYVLLMIVLFCILSIIMLILLLFIRRIVQTFTISRNNEYEKKLQEDLVSFLFYEETMVKLPPTLAEVNSNYKRKILTNKILQLYSNIIGSAAERLHVLYTDQGLDKISLENLKRNSWSVKAMNINILSKMNIQKAVANVAHFLNSDNYVVRKEAEVAMVNLDREHPFDFLNNKTLPLSDWEQMNMYDALIRNSIKPPDFSKWLDSNNDSVVMFSLKMIRMFRQNDAFEKVLSHLKHANENVRYQAILTTNAFRKEESVKHLIEMFKNENFRNKEAIIRGIENLKKPSNIEFLKTLIFNAEMQIKIEATKAIAYIGIAGKRELQEMLNTLNDEQIIEVIKHVLDKRNE